MIHHVSFGVSDPERVARALAELTGAVARRAPSPPFPHRTWFVTMSDDRGSLLEVLPATTALDPDAPLGLRQRPAPFQPSSTHVLISSCATVEEIEAVAVREGWRAQRVNTGRFAIVKLWIDRVVLVELFARGEAARYVALFGAEGAAFLDDELRAMETETKAMLESKLNPAQLEAALGPETTRR